MANGTRIWTLVISLAVGVAAGWFIGHSANVPVPAGGANPGDHLINVGPKPANVGTVISKSGKHQIFWKPRNLPANVAKLRILFMKGDFPAGTNKEPPFDGGTNDTDQYFDCEPQGVCKSGPANQKFTGTYSYYYKYWQQFLDANGNVIDQADAGIIIEQ